MKTRTFPANQRYRVKRAKRQRRRFYDRNGRRCWYCGIGVKKKEFRLEHQTPFAQGGSCKLSENIVLSCPECDMAKGLRNVEQFREYLSDRYGVEVQFYGETGRMLKLREAV